MKLKTGTLAALLFGQKHPTDQAVAQQSSLPASDPAVAEGNDFAGQSPDHPPDQQNNFIQAEGVCYDTGAETPNQFTPTEVQATVPLGESNRLQASKDHPSADVCPADARESEQQELTMASESYDDYEEHEHIILNYSEAQLNQCRGQIDNLMQVCPDAYGALISTVDGHEVVYKLKRNIPIHKIATMNSSLLALGETIARESEQSLCQFVILENSDGRVVSLRINRLVMLTCISSKEVNLGMLLSVGRSTASALERILSA